MARRSFGGQPPLRDFVEVARDIVRAAASGPFPVPTLNADPLPKAQSEAVAVVAALIQGCGVRDTVHRTGIPRHRIKRQVLTLGPAAARLHTARLASFGPLAASPHRTLALRLKTKGPTRPSRGTPGFTAVWAWTATVRESRLVSSCLIAHDDCNGLRVPGTGTFPAGFHIAPALLNAIPESSVLKVRTHAAALALQVLLHNFCRPATDQCRTPSMAAGLENHPWSAADVVAALAQFGS